MKFTKYFMPLAAVALLASCSNDNLDAPGVDNNPTTGADAYVSVSISMPASLGTKAVSYEPGDEDEYKVKNGTVMIFQQESEDVTDEGDFTFLCQGSLNTMAWGMNGQDQVTTSSKSAVATFDAGKLTNLTANTYPKYYALVILNENKLKHSPAVGTKFSVWQTTAQTMGEATGDPTTDADIYGSTSTGFTMTNAPLINASNEVSTLVLIDNTKISTQPTNLDPAAEIYVQRVAAKVSVTSISSDKPLTAFPVIINNTTSSDVVEFTGWGLDVTNLYTFPVQVADNYSEWKASDNTSYKAWLKETTALNKADGTASGYYRIFWAEDPNYDKNDTRDAYKNYTNAFARLADANATNPLNKDLYCLENTMNYQQMIQDQTTTAVLKGIYKIGGTASSFINFGSWRVALNDDFWKAKDKLGNAASDAYLELTKVDPETGLPSSEETAIARTKGESKILLTDLFTLTGAGKTAYKAVLNGDKSSDDEDYIQESTELTGDQIKAGVIYYINAYTSEIGLDQRVDYYHNGEIYYRARIHHFNDTDTPRPGNFTGIINQSGNATEYTADVRGRFGVLRNNWYEVAVKSITGLGDPTIPTDDDLTKTDDDPDKQYMECTINILSWAIRSHGYDF